MGFSVWVQGVRAEGLVLSISGLGFRVYGLGSRIHCFGFSASGIGFSVLCSGFRDGCRGGVQVPRELGLSLPKLETPNP